MIESDGRETNQATHNRAQATLRFYEELNDYLPTKMRKRDIAVHFKPPCPIRHLIETQGVPHTEVEIILLNGISVDLEAPAHDGDRVSIYPMFEALDVTPLLRLRPGPLREPRFFADAQLGRLTRYLRLLGFDTVYENGIDDADLVQKATAGRRIILSRDRALLMRRDVSHGLHIRNDNPMEQLAQVVRRCDLSRASRPFTRCMECNGTIEAISKQDVAATLEHGTLARFENFWRCGGCGHIYWKGSHYERLQHLVTTVLDDARQQKV